MDLVVIIAVIALVLVGASAVVLVANRRRDESLGVGDAPPASTSVEAPPAEAGPASATATVEPDVVEAPPGPPPTFRDRLGKARGALGGYLSAIRSRKVDDATWDELEEGLIRADVGVATTQRLLDDLRAVAKAESISDPDALIDRLKVEIKALLAEGDRDLVLRADEGRPDVWLFVGVNGVGKTTTIGKLARQQIGEGRSVVMAAGDTFRAAAAEQLTTWAERSGADIVRGNEGGDPSAVIYDAVQRAAARGGDLVLGDTAGRLHTKTNLMEELRKVRRVADREPGQVSEVLLVLDATTGQNGLTQAQQFTEAVDLTGVVLTKLDGSAKGGIALAVETTLGIPIKLVGLGEKIEDLVVFDPDEFVEALFS